MSVILADERLSVLDVGSRGGAPERIRRVAAVVDLVAIDDAAEMTSSTHFHSLRSVDLLLADRVKDVEFHVTRNPKLSSVFRPNRLLLDRFERAERADVLSRPVRKSSTIDLVCEDHRFAPDIIKLDTQGSELQILIGAERTLSSTVIIEAEVEFREIYEHQPLFAEVNALLTEQGFVLLDWTSIARWQRGTTNGLRSGLGELVDADAIYVRPPELISAAMTTADLRRYLAVLFLYGRFELMRDALDTVAEARLDKESTRRIRATAGRLERRLGRARSLQDLASGLGSLMTHPVAMHLTY